MLFTPKDLLVIFTGLLSLILAGFLLSQPQSNTRANRLLAVFLSIQALGLFTATILYGQLLHNSPGKTALRLFYLENALIPLEGFFLYCYCQTLLFKKALTLRTAGIHLGFISLLVGACIAVYAQADVFQYLNLRNEQRPAEIGIAYTLVQFVRFLYVLLCGFAVRSYHQRMAQQYSNMDKIDFRWLSLLLYALLIVRGGWMLLQFISVLYTDPAWQHPTMVIFALMASDVLPLAWFITQLSLMFFGLRYSSNFEGIRDGSNDTKLEPAANNDKLLIRLENHMESKRPYINANLRLDDLATEVSLPAKTLSNLINTYFDANFCEYINRYRVEAAAKILTDNHEKKRNILDVAHSVGFNSKSSFNRAFKLRTGYTPLHYKKLNLKEA